MKKSEVKVGMEVTLTEEMYGDHYGRGHVEPICRDIDHKLLVQPGMRGTVARIDIPVVCHTPGNPMSFLCVDFIEPETGCRFRTRPWYKQIRRYQT